MNRRQFLATSALAATAVTSLDHVASAARPARSATTSATTQAVKIPDDVVWHDVRDFGVEGRAFDDTENYFDRLPARAKGVVRESVWDLSRHTAGMSIRFDSDAAAMYVRYTLLNANLAMGHMPATGVSGVDLYARDASDSNGTWGWIATKTPTEQTNVGLLIRNMSPARRQFLLHLPLYNGVKSLEIGLAKDANVTPIPPRKSKPILFYGTSITQGGCASRPGMAFTNILARRLDKPVLNFGFSGNGRMEVEVVKFLVEIDASIFVLDCLANMGAVPVTERTEAVVRLIRETRPESPILILEERPYADIAVLPERAKSHADRCRELRTAYDNLTQAGVTNLHYRTGADVIGADREGTVDGSHPTDLGMVRYADALEPTLRKLL